MFATHKFNSGTQDLLVELEFESLTRPFGTAKVTER